MTAINFLGEQKRRLLQHIVELRRPLGGKDVLVYSDIGQAGGAA